MKKICYVTTIPGSLGFFKKELNYMASHGLSVTAISSGSIDSNAGFNNEIRFITVDMPRGVSFFRSLKSIKELKRIFKEEKFDIIQYSTPNAAFYASIAAKMSRCNVRNYHLMGLRYLGASNLFRKALKLIEKRTCANSTYIECVSKSNMEIGIQDNLFSPSKATVVWNGSSGGVDIERFDFNKRLQWRKEVRNALGFSESDFIYGFVGRITRDKGINELLSAFLLLEDDTKLLLIGRMENEDTLQNDVYDKARNCPNITFHPAVKDIERYYAAIDVLILPSYREGFGNVIIEAGAVGTPAIVSDIPGPTDAIIPGVTALTTPPKDISALKDAMVDIRNRDLQKMSLDAVDFVKEHFDSEILCQYIYDRKIQLLESENNIGK